MSPSDSTQLLNGCLAIIKQQLLLMGSSLDNKKLLVALKHCSTMVNELRTSNLSPKQYYELYVLVYDALDLLCQKLALDHKKSLLPDLYELVQYAGNIVPRLYMMIAVGTTLMDTESAPKSDLLRDMLEMCRGVQHPIRGLFLRYYLAQRTKNRLPSDSLDDLSALVAFLTSNFVEMNKLWVRWQHHGHTSGRERRVSDRLELKILVSANLVRLSQLIDDYSGPGKDAAAYSPIEYYEEHIFPSIAEQIVQCRDELAQSYLVDVLLHVFPSETHAATLDSLLGVILQLVPEISRSSLLDSLVTRFTSLPQSPDSQDRFETFVAFYRTLAENHNIDAAEHASILKSLLRLLLATSTATLDNACAIFDLGNSYLSSSAPENQESWTSLLLLTIESTPSCLALCRQQFFSQVFHNLKPSQQCKLALAIAQNVLHSGPLLSIADIDAVFSFLQVLVCEQKDTVSTAQSLGVEPTIAVSPGITVSTAFLAHQEVVCAVIQSIDLKNPFKVVPLLLHVRKRYLNRASDNALYTTPTVVNRLLHCLHHGAWCIDLLHRSRKPTEKWESQLRRTFTAVSLIIDNLYANHPHVNAGVVLNLYISTALVADQAQFADLANELFNQCFVVYEESILAAPATASSTVISLAHDAFAAGLGPYTAIVAIANGIYATRNLNHDHYRHLVSRVSLYGLRLLKKTEQCRAVYACAHLWCIESVYKEGEADTRRVLECLQKALRVADSVIDPLLSLRLFIEILQRCLMFHTFSHLEKVVSADYIRSLVDLIRTNISTSASDHRQSDHDENDSDSRVWNSCRALFNRVDEYMARQGIY